MHKRHSISTIDVENGIFFIKDKSGGIYVIDSELVTIEAPGRSENIAVERVGVILCEFGKKLMLVCETDGKKHYLNPKSEVSEIWELESADEISFLS